MHPNCDMLSSFFNLSREEKLSISNEDFYRNVFYMEGGWYIFSTLLGSRFRSHTFASSLSAKKEYRKHRINVISGANNSGKTLFVKTIGRINFKGSMCFWLTLGFL